jgi:hypothetical protein
MGRIDISFEDSLEHLPLYRACLPVILGNRDDGTVVLEYLELGGTSLMVFCHVSLFVAEFCELVDPATQSLCVYFVSIGFERLGLPAAEGFLDTLAS